MILLVIVAFILFGTGSIVTASSDDANHTEGWMVPNPDGTSFWMTKEQYEKEFANTVLEDVVLKYYLYTRASTGTPDELFLDDEVALKDSKFDNSKPTKIIIHGWQNDYQSDVNKFIREAYFGSGTPNNIISVDWSSIAGKVYYPSARNAVPRVGETVAAFIDFLHEKGQMPFSLLQVIGHSLGAHVSGFAGKRVKKGKIPTIFGLDPAYPLFSYSNRAERLSDTDADFVETIQTAGGYLGFLEPIGQSSFYPNGGKAQPGCGLDLIATCAHSRAYIYYAESVLRDDFPCMKCVDYHQAVEKNCGKTYSGIKMGSPSSYGSKGFYFVPVNDSPPYGKDFMQKKTKRR